MEETATVIVAVVEIVGTPGAGRLMALATVDLEIEGVAMRLTGVRLVKRRDQDVTVELPMTRDPLGRQVPCIQFPPEIHEAIEEAITREVVGRVAELINPDGPR
jgi:hypothetical protein